MNTKNDRHDNVNKTIWELSKMLHMSIDFECDEDVLHLPNSIGSGTIRGVNFPFGLSAVILQSCTFKHCVDIPRDKGVDYSPLRFLYVLSGELQHKMNDKVQYELMKHEVSLAACTSKCRESIIFPENQLLNIVIIQIDRNAWYERVKCELDLLPDNLSRVFSDRKAKRMFHWMNMYSVSIAECLESIKNNERNSTISRYFIEAKLYEILSHQFKQYEVDIDPKTQDILLRSEDVELIKRGKQILLENLNDAPTIVELSRMVGVNQQKFKKGFKQLYHSTPYRFLRNARLNESKLLLVNGKLSIGEVAERVGYTNKSHFARRFREKFGVLPSEFTKKFHLDQANHDRSNPPKKLRKQLHDQIENGQNNVFQMG